nr:MAG TPA: Type II secretion system, protein M [Caudoviricetes sp.]
MIIVNLIEILQSLLSWIPEDSPWYLIAQLIIVLIVLGSLAFFIVMGIKNGNVAKVAQGLNTIRKIMEDTAKATEQLKSKNQVDELSSEAKRAIVLAAVKNACIEHGMEYVEEYWDKELTDYIANTKQINYRG